MILYLLVKAFSSTLPLLPLSLAYWLADRIADVTFFFWREGRANMLDNMYHVLGSQMPPAFVSATARKAMRNYLRYLVDFFRMPRMTDEELRERIHFPNLQAMHQALKMGKGVILVGIHMGNWDFGGSILSLLGFPVDGVVDTFPNPRLNAFVQSTRQRFGMGVIPRENVARRVLNALRRGRAIAFAMDRPQSEEQGVGVRFFGCATYVPAGAATLSLRTGAVIVPASVVRLADDTFLGLMSPECITYEPTGDNDKDIRALTQRIMDVMGQWIQYYPEQWYVFSRIWPASDQGPAFSH